MDITSGHALRRITTLLAGLIAAVALTSAAQAFVAAPAKAFIAECSEEQCGEDPGGGDSGGDSADSGGGDSTPTATQSSAPSGEPATPLDTSSTAIDEPAKDLQLDQIQQDLNEIKTAIEHSHLDTWTRLPYDSILRPDDAGGRNGDCHWLLGMVSRGQDIVGELELQQQVFLEREAELEMLMKSGRSRAVRRNAPKRLAAVRRVNRQIPPLLNQVRSSLNDGNGLWDALGCESSLGVGSTGESGD